MSRMKIVSRCALLAATVLVLGVGGGCRPKRPEGSISDRMQFIMVWTGPFLKEYVQSIDDNGGTPEQKKLSAIVRKVGWDNLTVVTGGTSRTEEHGIFWAAIHSKPRVAGDKLVNYARIRLRVTDDDRKFEVLEIEVPE